MTGAGSRHVCDRSGSRRCLARRDRHGSRGHIGAVARRAKAAHQANLVHHHPTPASHRLRAFLDSVQIREAAGHPAHHRQPFGERVLLWCVAGISAEDLRGAKEALIAACWATDMRITASERHAHLVVVDVIRHHPPEPPGPEPERMTWPG